MDVETLRVRCREKGLRLTVQKVAVLEALAGMRSHPSAEQVFEVVRERLPQIARTTVFRVLDELVRHRIVRRLHHDGRPVRYDPNPSSHHHLQCERCGRIEDIELPALDAQLARQPLGDFERAGATVVFWGVCGRCRHEAPAHPAG